MKLKSFVFIAVLLIWASGFAAVLKKEFKTDPGKTLSVDASSGGSIEIAGWDQNLISVEVYYADEELDENAISFRERSNGLEIEVGFWRDGDGHLEFKINVPRKFNVEVQTMGGDISIRDVDGEFTGQTMGGDLELTGVKGRSDLTTMGGSITLLDSDLDGSLSTMGGEVLFENVAGDVKGSSMGGDVTMKNVRMRNGEWKAREKEVNITTMGGSITVDDAPMGAKVNTMGGDIDIRKAKVYADATTMGGDIDIREIDGWIKASTMGGNVTAVMVGDPTNGERHVDLTSMGGDIDVTLPADLSIEFEVRLSYTKNSRKNYKIISDFDIKTEESKDWIYSHGSPRKDIYGTGKINGGKNLVKIETINGDIRIRKGK
jgi:DUF4097 and DUF4098 domain-containing protein YvlB